MTTDRITLVHTGLILEPGSSLSLSFLFFRLRSWRHKRIFFFFFCHSISGSVIMKRNPGRTEKGRNEMTEKKKKNAIRDLKFREITMCCAFIYFIFFARWIHSCTLEHQSRIRMPCVAVQSLAETLREGERNIEIHYSIASCWAVTERCLVNPDWTSSFKTKKFNK